MAAAAKWQVESFLHRPPLLSTEILVLLYLNFPPVYFRCLTYFILITPLNHNDLLIINKERRVFIYINLWKHLTYPISHEAALKQVEGILRVSQTFLPVSTVRIKCNRKRTHLIAPALQ